MKKVLLGAMVVLLAAAIVFAGAKRITTFRGTETIAIEGNDSTGWLGTDKYLILNEGQNQKYDKFIGSVIMPTLSDPGDSTGEGNVDSLIVRYYFGTDWYKLLLEADTITLPGTTFVAFEEDIWTDPTATVWIAANDSSSAYAHVVPKLTGDYPAFMFDHFWVDGDMWLPQIWIDHGGPARGFYEE